MGLNNEINLNWNITIFLIFFVQEVWHLVAHSLVQSSDFIVELQFIFILLLVESLDNVLLLLTEFLNLQVIQTVNVNCGVLVLVFDIINQS